MTSFLFAITGLIDAITNERNFRLHWLCGMMVLLLINLLTLRDWQQIILLLLIFLVLAAELFNSALEKVCDSSGREFNTHKKYAKDFAAGAVLLMSFVAAIVFASFIFDDPDAFFKPFAYNAEPFFYWAAIFLLNAPMALSRRANLFSLACFLASMVLESYFIFFFHQKSLFLILGLFFHGALCIAYLRQTSQAKTKMQTS